MVAFGHTDYLLDDKQAQFKQMPLEDSLTSSSIPLANNLIT